MSNKLLDIYIKYGLLVYNVDGSEKTFSEVLSQIYYGVSWNKERLISFMTEIMQLETKTGDPFNED